MSKKKNKYQFFKSRDDGGVNQFGILDLESKIRQTLTNKYYNIWMSKFKWGGLDEGVAHQQENFIMRKFWADGTVSCRYMRNIDTLVFTPYTGSNYDLYDFPSEVTLVNLRNAPISMVPETIQVVGRDVVLGWAQPNHKPIAEIVRFYVDRMTQVQMVINTNLQLQKMPFLVGVNETDSAKMKDVVRRILNNEIVIFADLEDLQRIQTLVTQSPYIIDKLTEHYRGLEQELLTYIGVDNNGSQSLEQTHVSVDAVNANNDVINDYGRAIENEIQKWLDGIERVFGRRLTIEPQSRPVNTIHEQEEKKDEKIG